MIDRWGYKLASHPNDKSSRASYKMTTHSAVLHDASYTECIQVAGPLSELTRIFASLADPTLPSPAATRFTDGVRYGVTNLYEEKKYPYGFICEATFLWRPEVPEAESELEIKVDSNVVEASRTVWVWVHPAAGQQTLDTLNRTIRQEPTAAASVSVINLSGELLKFELCGPRAHDVLANVLQVYNQGADSKTAEVWQALKALRTPSSLPKDVVLALTVQDPRLSYER